MLKKKSKGQLNIITVKGKDVKNPKNITKAFKKVLIKIGPSLSKTITKSKRQFKNFLYNSSLNLFVLKPVSRS